MADEDDPVIEEYDVFVNQDIAGALHVLQFPLRPRDRPYEMDNITRVRVGCTSNRVTFEMEEAIHGCEFFPSDRMEADVYKYVLRGGAVMNNAELGYNVAVFRPGEVHLTPVATLQQLRPDLTAATDLDLDDDGPMFPKTVQSHQIIKPRGTFVYDEKREECLTMPCCSKDAGSIEHSALVGLLCAPTATQWPYEGSKTSVPHQMCPVIPSTEYKPAPSSLGAYSLDRQVFGLMISAEVLSLKTLRAFVVPPSDLTGERLDAILCRALETCAVLVRGTWICKMSKGHLPPRAALVREHCILLLNDTDGGVVREAVLSQYPPTMAKPITEVISALAVLNRTTRRWELKNAGDGSEPEAIVHNQRMNWVKRREEILENVKQLSQPPGATKAPLPRASMAWAPPPPEPLLSSNNPAGAVPADRALRDAAYQDVLAVLRHLYATHGVINGQMIMQLIRREKGKPDSKLRNVSDEMCRECIKANVCRISENATILKLWADPAVDEFRTPMVELFRARTALSRAEITEHLQKTMSKEIPPAVFKRIVSELADYKANESKWTLKSGIVP